MPRREVSEQEFDAIRDRVLASMPEGLTEEQFNRLAPTMLDGALAEAEHSPAPVEGGAMSRFLSNAGEMVNPAAIAKGLYDSVRHPVETYQRVAEGVEGQIDKAGEAFRTAQRPRDYVAAAGHAAGALPVIGPAAAAAGEQIESGDWAGGVGKGVGLLAPAVLAPAAVRGTRAAVRKLPDRVAQFADEAAASRVADVISPKVGQNKVRLGNRAEEIAPALAKDLAADGAPLTRSGYHSEVRTKLSAAEQALDAASDARLSARTFPTNQLIGDLMKKRSALTAEAADATGISYQQITVGGKPATTWIKNRGPLGKDVVPGPNAARVAAIDQAIAELRTLGPVTSYDPIRTLRQAYDGQAKVAYNPAVTADFLKARGSALGAADVTSVLRDALAKWDPQTARANAQYSLYRTADDVLSATAEVERTRPKVGRQIIARMTGTIVGNQTAGAAGAAAGYVAGPIVDSALASGFTTQLKTAALMTKLSQAIRRGSVPEVTSLTAQLKRLGATASAIVGNTSNANQAPATTPTPATR